MDVLPSREHLRANLRRSRRFRWSIAGGSLILVGGSAKLGGHAILSQGVVLSLIISAFVAVVLLTIRWLQLRRSGIRITGNTVRVWSPRAVIETTTGPHLRIVNTMQMEQFGGLPAGFRIHDTESGRTVVLEQMLFDPVELQMACEILTPHHTVIYIDQIRLKLDPMYKPCLSWFWRHLYLAAVLIVLGLIVGIVAVPMFIGIVIM